MEKEESQSNWKFQETRRKERTRIERADEYVREGDRKQH